MRHQVAGAVHVILAAIIAVADELLRLDAVLGSLLLDVFNEFAEFFDAADIIEEFDLAFNLALPVLILDISPVLILEIRLEACELAGKVIFLMSLSIVNLIDHISCGHHGHPLVN